MVMEEKVKNIRALIITAVEKYDLFNYDIKLIDDDDLKDYNNAMFQFYISYIENKLNNRGFIDDKEYLLEKKDYGLLITNKENELQDMIMY